jgi:GNAT superfamily N-acetyltransferase
MTGFASVRETRDPSPETCHLESLNAMSDVALVERLESALYETAGRGGIGELVRRPDWVQLTTPEAKTPFRNGILRSIVTVDALAYQIERAVAHYRRYGVPFRWFVTPSTRPVDTGDALIDAGFVHADTLHAMAASPADFPEPRRDDVTVEVVGPDTVETWLSVEQRGWGMPDAGIERFRKEVISEVVAAPEPTSIYYLARLDGEPAGTASVALCGDSAHFKGSVVREEFRRRGIYTELIYARMRDLRARGIGLATIHGREATSAPVCAKLGFETACRFHVYEMADR